MPPGPRHQHVTHDEYDIPSDHTDKNLPDHSTGDHHLPTCSNFPGTLKPIGKRDFDAPPKSQDVNKHGGGRRRGRDHLITTDESQSSSLPSSATGSRQLTFRDFEQRFRRAQQKTEFLRVWFAEQGSWAVFEQRKGTLEPGGTGRRECGKTIRVCGKSRSCVWKKYHGSFSSLVVVFSASS